MAQIICQYRLPTGLLFWHSTYLQYSAVHPLKPRLLCRRTGVVRFTVVLSARKCCLFCDVLLFPGGCDGYQPFARWPYRVHMASPSGRFCVEYLQHLVSIKTFYPLPRCIDCFRGHRSVCASGVYHIQYHRRSTGSISFPVLVENLKCSTHMERRYGAP
jgi:hypothetical protein